MARPPFRFPTGPVFPPPGVDVPRLPGDIRPDPGLLLDPVRDRVPDIVIDPGRLPPNLPEAAPLLLLPLRIEYRLVEVVRPPKVVVRPDRAPARAAALKQSVSTNPATARRGAAALARLQAERTKTFRPMEPVLAGARELWVRWFPDADFAQAGVAPVREDEAAALGAFRAAAAPDWWRLPDAATAGAWATLAATCGPARALHLLRGGTGGDPAAIGRITALPRRVALFALTGGKIEPVATGADIPANAASGAGPVAYSPDALEPGGWLADFPTAVARGMGVKLTDPAAIDRALAADWIAAVGLASGDARPEIAALLADGIAGDGFAMLPQDGPTNNAPGARSPQRGWRDDPAAFLAAATEDEQGRHDGSVDRAADLLAGALGLDPALCRRAVGGADTAFADARAMMRVIAPGMLDGAYDGTVWGQDLDENDVIDIIAAFIAARGTLPAVRMGNNPYGIVVLTRAAEADPGADPLFSETERRVLSSLHALTEVLRPASVARAQENAPRLRPDAPTATAATLEAILQNAPASRRIELAEGSDAPEALGCAYVAGSRPEYQPMAYLSDLRRKRPSDLPDPDASDRRWPLLYRLARLTLTRNVAQVLSIAEIAGTPPRLAEFEALPKAERDRAFERFEGFAGELGLTIGRGADRRAGRARPARVTPLAEQRARRLFGAFDAGLSRLAAVAARPNGTAELETLMFEVFDTLQHRLDAWATGIALARLNRRRAAGATGLQAGYWGLLGKLRTTDKLAADDGYVQAPSLAQATTAAVLRSAYRRHPDGAFNLDLSSARVRRGIAVLDLLSGGAPLAAALGLRAERALRDARPKSLSHLIPGLRRVFPIRTETPPETEADPAAPAGRAGAPMLDGLALIAASPSRFAAADRAAIAAIVATLSDDLDAVADIVMAEAVHHRAMGAAAAANAWLSVLSGGTLPGRPVFLRTDRPRQASSHRVTLLVPAAATGDPETAAPRALADPGLAALAAAVAGDVDALTLEAGAVLVSDAAATAALKLSVGRDLGLSAIDLMVGGESELSVRARAEVVRRWQAGDAALAPLGALPGDARPDDLALMTVAPGKDLAAALARLVALRRTVGQGRAVEPGDLSAAADAAVGELADADTATLTAGAVQELDSRVAALAKALDFALTAFAAARSVAMTRLMQAQLELDRDPASPAAALAWVRATEAVAALSGTLPRAAAMGEPNLLRPLSVARLLQPGDDGLVRLASGERRLRAKLTHLRGLAPLASGADLATARAALALRTEALRAVLDGPGTPVLPVWSRTAATTPALEPAVGFPAAAGRLADWGAVRSRIATLARALDPAPAGFRLWPVAAAATAGGGDPRPEDEAPRARHFGLFLAPSDPAAAARLCGVVVDDWTETRASRDQDAAVAINVNTPNAQAPNAMLLCVPPSADWKAWSEERAAGMVAEAADLMRMRALTSDQRLVPVAFSPFGNSVPHKGAGPSSTPRLPVGKSLIEIFLQEISGAGLFVTDASRQPGGFGIAASGLNVSTGFAFKED